MSDHVPTVGELRRAYVEASGASMAQESYYAEQVAEFERGIARIKADVQREALLSDESIEQAALGIHASHDRGDWDEELPVVQDEYLDMARAALAAALGEDEGDE